MLIVEGPDGGGKTTLAKRLSEDLGWPIAPRVVATDTTPMVDLKHWVEDNVAKGFHETIYDRHRLISEPIYGTLRRPRDSQIAPGFNNLNWFADWHYQFWGIEPIVICCLPPMDLARERAMFDESNHIFDGVEYDQLYRMYYYWIGQNWQRVIWYNPEEGEPEYKSIFKLIELRIKAEKFR